MGLGDEVAAQRFAFTSATGPYRGSSYTFCHSCTDTQWRAPEKLGQRDHIFEPPTRSRREPVRAAADRSGTPNVQPIGGLATDGAGNLFGTASLGGANGSGTVFEVMPPAIAGAAWNFRLVFPFTGGADGGNPEGALIYLNHAVFGTTPQGGLHLFGTVFKVAPTHNNAWGNGTTETPVWQFTGGAHGGNQHFGGLLLFVQDLYGTNVAGGVGNGVAFQLH